MKIPNVGSKEVIKALTSLGFVEGRRSSGSHQAFSKLVAGECRTVIVVRAKKEIPVGTLDSIIMQSGYSREEFVAAMTKKPKFVSE